MTVVPYLALQCAKKARLSYVQTEMFTALYRLETEILAGLLGSSCWLQ